MSIQIIPVSTRGQHRAFAKFPWRVYHDDPNWVPPIMGQRKAYLKHRAPFFEFGEGEFFLARAANDGQILGTIGLAIDHARNRDLGQQRATFGFFDILPGDTAYNTAAALWEHAVAWGRAKHMELLVGPYSFGFNNDPGFLIEGYDIPPAILMGHTPPTYAQYAERYGFVKHADSLAYRLDFAYYNYSAENVPPLIKKIAARANKRLGQHVIRPARLDDWDAEIGRAIELYNNALSVLPDWTPIQEPQFRHMAADMRRIIDPDMILFAEVDGKTVGLAIGLPNIAEALHHANGLRTPLDIIRYLIHRRRVTGFSYKIMAIHPDYLSMGIDILMYLQIGTNALRRGYKWVDASLTLESNPFINKLMPRFGFEPYKRYRVYKLPLTPNDSQLPTANS